MRGLLRAVACLLLACSHARQPQTADADADKCATVADCHGMLPHLCRACADGGTECSRWACVSGVCMVAPACQ
jgi:hypothetical protein